MCDSTLVALSFSITNHTAPLLKPHHYLQGLLHSLPPRVSNRPPPSYFFLFQAPVHPHNHIMSAANTLFCEICRGTGHKGFSRRYHYDRHMQRHSLNPPMYPCTFLIVKNGVQMQYDRKPFTQAGNLQEHIDAVQ